MAKLVVFFPGIGYHCDKPLLYYGRDIAYEAGYEKNINMSYEYHRFDIKNPDSMRAAALELLRQAEEQLKDIDWQAYDEIVFIAKSIGTTIAANLAEKYNSEVELKAGSIKLILLTPLIQTFQWEIDNAIAFLGTKDQFSKVEDIQALTDKNNIPLYIYEECNHSLECDDTIKNLEIITDVMKKISGFIR